MRKIAIIGCGAVGRQVAELENANGSEIWFSYRSKPVQSWADDNRYHYFQLDLDEPQSASGELLPTLDCLYYFVPPGPTGRLDERSQVFIDSFLSEISVCHLVLISTTGVYGDCGGAWIDETAPTAPLADRAWRRVHAEHCWSEYASSQGLTLTVLRVAGIYGPNKLPLERLRRQDPVLQEQDSPWSNRIHIDDLSGVCLAAGNRPQSSLYNVVDDEPGTMTDYFLKVADCVGLPRPTQIGLAEAKTRLSAGILSYLSESRRISNRRLKMELGFKLKYPTLTAGLQSIALTIERPAQ